MNESFTASDVMNDSFMTSRPGQGRGGVKATVQRPSSLVTFSG